MYCGTGFIPAAATAAASITVVIGVAMLYEYCS